MRIQGDLRAASLSVPVDSSLSTSQLHVNALESGVASTASNGRLLTSITLASGAFSLARTAATALFSNFLGGLALRAAAGSVGFMAEVLAFRGSDQVLHGRSESFLNRQGLASTAMDFLLLKGAGAMVGNSPYVMRHAAQGLAMGVGESLRDSRSGNFSEKWAHGFAMSVAMEAGGNFRRLVNGGRIESLQRNLQTQTEFRQLNEGRVSANSRARDVDSRILRMGADEMPFIFEFLENCLKSFVRDPAQALQEVMFADPAKTEFKFPARDGCFVDEIDVRIRRNEQGILERYEIIVGGRVLRDMTFIDSSEPSLPN